MLPRNQGTSHERSLLSRLAVARDGAQWNDPSLEAEATLLDGVALTIVRSSNEL